MLSAVGLFFVMIRQKCVITFYVKCVALGKPLFPSFLITPMSSAHSYSSYLGHPKVRLEIVSVRAVPSENVSFSFSPSWFLRHTTRRPPVTSYDSFPLDRPLRPFSSQQTLKRLTMCRVLATQKDTYPVIEALLSVEEGRYVR